MAVDETEVAFGAVDGNSLMGVLYRPRLADMQAVPMAIDIHGGAWSAGHRKSDRFYCRKLAAFGVAILSIDFRYGPDAKHPAANEDISQAVKFAQTLLPEPGPIGLIGSSSGGHLALLSGLKPDAFHQYGTSCAVDFVVAQWPVSNPLARYQYVTARGLEDPGSWHNFHPLRLAQGHRGYFETEAAMHDAAIQRVLSEQEFTSLPSIMIVQPELDQNVPVFMSQTLHGALLSAGAEVDYRLYPGVEHSFAMSDGPQTDQCIADVAAFIKGCSAKGP
jgi:acetyl esterase/lipase